MEKKAKRDDKIYTNQMIKKLYAVKTMSQHILSNIMYDLDQNKSM
jgi:hypothetical protein